MKYFFSVIFFLLLSMNSHSIECIDLVGKWKGETFSQKTKLLIKSTQVFSEDTTYTVNFEVYNGEGKRIQLEKGKWFCIEDLISVEINEIDGHRDNRRYEYQINELNSSYLSYTTILANCEAVDTDCAGTTYEFTKFNQ